MFASKDVFLTPPSGGYTIARSVRLRSSASAYFNRTTTTPTSGSIFTHSFWVKRGILGAGTTLISGARPTNFDRIYIQSNDTLLYQWNDGTSNLAYVETTQVFRDPSAWYHILIATDTTQATASNRVKIYVNGVQVTALTSTTYPTQNSTSYFNTNAVTLNIGRSTNATFYLDGYLTEINFIDGQALTPSSFGTTNSITGVWQPAKYTGTYGTNGFYLNFSDNSSNTAATIGKDYSGNGNNWTPNNISVTAGTTYDSMTDVPTLTSATAANYCVLNPLNPYGNSGGVMSISDGNLKGTGANTTRNVYGTTAVNSGKWYWEIYVSSYVNLSEIGVSDDTGCIGTGAVNYWAYTGAGNKEINGATTAYGATYTTGDTIGVALDLSANTLTFYKNNTSQGAITSVTGLLRPHCYITTAGVFIANFGQQPFTYTPPTGFVALNTYNLPASTITNGAAYMAATTYTGNLTGQSITNTASGASFQPDLVWIKSRSAATDNKLTDSVRGATKALISNTTGAETTDLTGVTAINSNGFTVGASTVYNNTGVTYVGWQWKAGTTSASNTNGSITSSVSANTTAGFSVVTYTGNGTSGATVGHGLGVAPKMVIVKSRSTVTNWTVWFTGFAGTDFIQLSTTNAKQTAATVWNSTVPTSTVFSIGADGSSNPASGVVAYCFSEVAGYSAFGSYTGNGSTDGTFVFTNFQPRFVMTKRTDSTGNWYVWDSARLGYNGGENLLYPDLSNAESSYGSAGVDLLSNGFKIRNTDASENASGGTYIYACFASNPFKQSLARQAWAY